MVTFGCGGLLLLLLGCLVDYFVWFVFDDVGLICVYSLILLCACFG